MWIQFVQAIPCIGFIMTLIWAFSGTNEQRKNYFKAHLVWLCIAITLWVALLSLGWLPTIKQQLKTYFASENSDTIGKSHSHDVKASHP